MCKRIIDASRDHLELHVVQQKPLRELGRLCLNAGGQSNVVVAEVCNETRGLPLLQVWPSDSPRGEADGQAQAFVFPDMQENVNSDSGIESIQVRLSRICLLALSNVHSHKYNIRSVVRREL